MIIDGRDIKKMGCQSYMLSLGLRTPMVRYFFFFLNNSVYMNIANTIFSNFSETESLNTSVVLGHSQPFHLQWLFIGRLFQIDFFPYIKGFVWLLIWEQTKVTSELRFNTILLDTKPWCFVSLRLWLQYVTFWSFRAFTSNRNTPTT